MYVLYVCIYMYLFYVCIICMYYMYVLYVCIYVYICMYIYVCIICMYYMYVLYVRIYVCIICMYICTYICMYYMYVLYVCIYIYVCDTGLQFHHTEIVHPSTLRTLSAHWAARRTEAGLEVYVGRKLPPPFLSSRYDSVLSYGMGGGGKWW